MISSDSCKPEASSDGEEGSDVAVSHNGDVVGRIWGHTWNIEGKTVGPATWVNHLVIGEVLVVDESSEEMALELNIGHVFWLNEDSAQVEVDGGSKNWRIGVAVGLGWIHDEYILSGGLSEYHRVWDSFFGLLVEGIKLALDKGWLKSSS